MFKLTYDQIQGFNPCYDSIKYISKDWTGTAIDILKLENVPTKDRLWVVVRENVLTLKQIHAYGLACARLSEKYSTDPRVKECNDTVQAYLEGTATNERLSAARSAARSAESAAWSAAWSARSAARSAESAARSAAESAARQTMEENQCLELLNILESGVK